MKRPISILQIFFFFSIFLQPFNSHAQTEDVNDIPLAEIELADSVINVADFDREVILEKFNNQLQKHQNEIFRIEQYLQSPETGSVFNNESFINLLSDAIEKMELDLKSINSLLSKNELLFSTSSQDSQTSSEVIQLNRDVRKEIYKANIETFSDLKEKYNRRITHYKSLVTQLSSVSYADLYTQAAYRAKLISGFPIYIREFQKGFNAAITQFNNDVTVWKTYPTTFRLADVVSAILTLLFGVYLFLRIKYKIIPYYMENRDSVNKRNAFIFFRALYKTIIPVTILTAVYMLFIYQHEAHYITFPIIVKYAGISFAVALFLFSLASAHAKFQRLFDSDNSVITSSGKMKRLFHAIFIILFANALVYQFFILNVSGQSQHFISLVNLFFTVILITAVFKAFTTKGWSGIISGVVEFERSHMYFPPLVCLALAVTVLFTIAGYVTLAHHIIFSFVFSIVVISSAFFIRSIFGEFISYITRIKSLRLRYGFTILSLQKFKFWTLSVFNLSLVGVTIVVLFLVWGFPSYKFTQLFSELYYGFAIGNLTFSIKGIFKAFLVFYAVIMLTRLIRNLLLKRILPQSTLTSGTQNTVATLSSYIGWIIAFSLSFAAMGISFQNIAIIAGALSVGIGFGLQNIVNNFVSGLILLFEQPIKVGDWVRVGAHEGYVKKLNVRSTEIKTFQKSSVIIPNADLISQPVINMTLNDSLGRVEVPVSVSYEQDIGQVRDILMSIVDNNPIILQEPHAEVLFMNYNSDRIDFEIRCFIDDINQLYIVSSDIRFEIFKKFKEHGIELPLPKQVLHISKDSKNIGRSIKQNSRVESNENDIDTKPNNNDDNVI